MILFYLVRPITHRFNNPLALLTLSVIQNSPVIAVGKVEVYKFLDLI